MQEGQDGAFAQGADIVVRGIAGHEQQFGSGSFKTARAANEVRQRIIAAAANVRRAVGDLRIAVDEDVQMILIAACSGVVGDFLVEVYGRLRPHAADDAKGFHALTPLRVHGDCSADRRARPCCVLRFLPSMHPIIPQQSTARNAERIFTCRKTNDKLSHLHSNRKSQCDTL